MRTDDRDQGRQARAVPGPLPRVRPAIPRSRSATTGRADAVRGRSSPMSSRPPRPTRSPTRSGSDFASSRAMTERAGWAWRALIHRTGDRRRSRSSSRSWGGRRWARSRGGGRSSLGATSSCGRCPPTGRRAGRCRGRGRTSWPWCRPGSSIRTSPPARFRRRPRAAVLAIEESVAGSTLAVVAACDDWPGGDAALVPILHAARGLLAAHEQGLAHGDPSRRAHLDRRLAAR